MDSSAYGILAARRVLRPSALEAAAGAAGSRRQISFLACLAMTWLNPHVYLDTVFLLGSLAADRGPLRWTFGLGAALASLCWFAALGFGARLRAASSPGRRPGGSWTVRSPRR